MEDKCVDESLRTPWVLATWGVYILQLQTDFTFDSVIKCILIPDLLFLEQISHVQVLIFVVFYWDMRTWHSSIWEQQCEEWSSVEWWPSHHRAKRGKILTAVRITTVQGWIVTWMYEDLFPQQHVSTRINKFISSCSRQTNWQKCKREVMNEAEVLQKCDCDYLECNAYQSKDSKA